MASTNEDFAIIWTKKHPQQQLKVKKAAGRKATQDEDPEDGPLIDTTAKLALHSKKTERLERRQERRKKKEIKEEVRSEIKCFLDLPVELLTEVLSFMLPSDILSLRTLNHFSRNFIDDNEQAIANRIIDRRYWVLTRCFQLPIPLSVLPATSQEMLVSESWQERLKIHKAGYHQHIPPINPSLVCTCMSCVLAWNNLNVVLDLAHWQDCLDNRQPLPVIPRGEIPKWNSELLDRHAAIVLRALMESPLRYARILQIHLRTLTRTILRNYPSSTATPSSSSHIDPPTRLYNLTNEDVARETDEFLDRYGPPSYQPVYMRDNYYTEEAFVPNRKWDQENQLWKYYARWPVPHQNDLAWLTARFNQADRT